MVTAARSGSTARGSTTSRTHPAFRNPDGCWRGSTTRFHDRRRRRLECTTDTGSGGYTPPHFRRAGERRRAASGARRDRRVVAPDTTAGWDARPTTRRPSWRRLGANADLTRDQDKNAAPVGPHRERARTLPESRTRPAAGRSAKAAGPGGDVYVHVEKETDAGLIVSGRESRRDQDSALTHANFISDSRHPDQEPRSRRGVSRDEHGRA